MKKLLLICFAMGLGFASFAQRAVDLSVESVEEPARIKGAGVQFPANFIIKNNGTDTLRAGDTLLFYFRINNQVNTNILFRKVGKDMAANDTMMIGLNLTLNINVTGAFEGDFCAICFAINRSDMDSLKTENGTTANNQACRRTFFGYNTGAEEISASAFQSMLFPNPANLNANLTYTLDQSAAVSIRLMDVTGKTLSTLVNGTRAAGMHQVDVPVHELPNGVYMYSIIAGDRIETRRFVVQH